MSSAVRATDAARYTVALLGCPASRAASAHALALQPRDAARSVGEVVRAKLQLYREALIAVPELALEPALAAARAEGAVATVLRRHDGGGADVLLRFREGEKPQTELRCAVIGNVDAGKSTLISVLSAGGLDDGRGAARKRVFRHAHEQETGRTSSVSQVSLLFNSTGRCLAVDAAHRGSSTDVAHASKVITLVDLAGHERYLRTTCFGLTGHLPDYAIALVGANAGLVGSVCPLHICLVGVVRRDALPSSVCLAVCKEHVGIALALTVPMLFVVTKMCAQPTHELVPICALC